MFKLNFLKEFKEFAMKGNLIDMAVAFVMGAAFGTFVNKFIAGLVMPCVGKLTAGVDFNSLKIVLSEAKLDAVGKVVAAEAAIMYGEFITACINFIIIAFCMFVVVKAMNKLKRKNEEIFVEPTITEEQKILTEIRDLLKERKR
ncbi:MAG: large-conductance mechanosensitive channel protein MscL [Bacteroidales bacterium]|jgi:large conductance mechanosensitive channel|nr:large-conductance mechanosensitive channel protein MscL [Bacteroidales bacterium]